MDLIIAAVAIGFAQHYLGWGDWLWWMFGGLNLLAFLVSMIKDKK